MLTMASSETRAKEITVEKIGARRHFLIPYAQEESQGL
jgi:hypothetical protein